MAGLCAVWVSRCHGETNRFAEFVHGRHRAGAVDSVQRNINNKAGARVNNSGSHCIAKQEPSLLHANRFPIRRLDLTSIRLDNPRLPLLMAVSLLA